MYIYIHTYKQYENLKTKKKLMFLFFPPEDGNDSELDSGDKPLLRVHVRQHSGLLQAAAARHLVHSKGHYEQLSCDSQRHLQVRMQVEQRPAVQVAQESADDRERVAPPALPY